MPHSELVQSLLKGLDLLKLISLKNNGVRLNELAAETGIKKTTLHNLLRTLCARDFWSKTVQTVSKPVLLFWKSLKISKPSQEEHALLIFVWNCRKCFLTMW